MSSPSDDLFRLIKSMNKSEKRHFKMLAGCKSGDKKYIELFDQINRQTNYDEQKLTKGGLRGKNLSPVKNYLFKSLLRSLAYWDSDPETELTQYLNEVRVLVSKDLYLQALKHLRKGIRAARKQESFSLLHALLDQKMDLLPRIQSEKALGRRLEEIHAEKQLALQKMHNLDEYNYLLQRSHLLMNTRNRVRRPEDRGELDRLLAHPLLRSREEALSMRAQIHFLTIHRMLASYQNHPARAQQFSLELIGIYREHDRLMRSGLYNFYAELTKYCIYTLRENDYPKVWKTIEEFRKYRDVFPNARLEHFQAFAPLMLGYSLQTGDLDRSMELVEEIEKEMVSFEEKITLPYLLTLEYYLAQLHFIAGRYSDCLRYINIFLSEPRSEYRIDLQILCRILRLMVYFQLGNYIACESDIQNVQRFMDRNDSVHHYEKSILQILRYLVNNFGLDSEKKLFQKALEAFDAQIQEKHHKGLDKLLNFRVWLASKIEDKPKYILLQEASSFAKESFLA